MAYNKDIVEKLSQFNNMSFTKKQWDIILKGCGCPKSNHFWSALRTYCLQKNQKLYTLTDISSETFYMIWLAYCMANREYVRKSYLRKKAKQAKKAEKELRVIDITFYMVDGYLTTDKPVKE